MWEPFPFAQRVLSNKPDVICYVGHIYSYVCQWVQCFMLMLAPSGENNQRQVLSWELSWSSWCVYIRMEAWVEGLDAGNNLPPHYILWSSVCVNHLGMLQSRQHVCWRAVELVCCFAFLKAMSYYPFNYIPLKLLILGGQPWLRPTLANGVGSSNAGESDGLGWLAGIYPQRVLHVCMYIGVLALLKGPCNFFLSFPIKRWREDMYDWG